MRFEDKVVIVTGGAQGIGMATSWAFAREGARVVVADIDREAGEELVQSIRSDGRRTQFIETDVGNEQDIQRMVETTIREYSAIDVLVNNAGIGSGGTIYDRPKDEWDRVIAVNLTGTYLCTKYSASHMRSRGGGVVINIASTRALMSEPNTEPYSATKGGLLALTHSMAVSLGDDGIRVNAISPGWIETGMHKKKALRREPHHTEADRQQHPVGRVGKPEDIAEACLYLASDQAGFITGQNLVIDGGMTIRMIYE